MNVVQYHKGWFDQPNLGWFDEHVILWRRQFHNYTGPCNWAGMTDRDGGYTKGFYSFEEAIAADLEYYAERDGSRVEDCITPAT